MSLRRSLRSRTKNVRYGQESPEPLRRRRVPKKRPPSMGQLARKNDEHQVIRQMLYSSSKGDVINYSDLQKLVTIKGKEKQKTIERAKKALKRVLNYEFKNLKTAKGKKYVLTCAETPMEDVLQPRHRRDIALKFVIMSIISLNGGKMEDSDVFRHLNNLGYGRRNSFGQFGTMKSFLTQMVKQEILKIVKTEVINETRTFYELGPRVCNESDFTRVNIYQFVYRTCRDDAPPHEDDFLTRCQDEDREANGEDVEPEMFDDEEEEDDTY